MTKFQGKQFKKYKCKLWFLCSARRRMLIGIYMTSLEDIKVSSYRADMVL